MSVYARKKRMTDTCTVWSLTSQSAYGAQWSNPFSVPCNYRNDSQMQVDDQGAEFSPNSVFRLFGDPGIKKGDRIVRGEYTDAKPTSDAQTVRKVSTKTAMRGQPAYTVFTG